MRLGWRARVRKVPHVAGGSDQMSIAASGQQGCAAPSLRVLRRSASEAGVSLSLCAAFALGLDRGHRVADHVHPAAGNQVTPGLAEPPKVCAELAAVAEPG